MQAYQGLFYSNKELLNRICWANNGTLGPGNAIIFGGVKRDQAVWPGDMGVAFPSTFVSIEGFDGVKNALQAVYDRKNSDGSFQEAGPSLLRQMSETYHIRSMFSTYNYLLCTDDTSFLQENQAKYLKAMDYIYGKVDSRGSLNVTGTCLYRDPLTGADLATWTNDTTGLNTTYTARATSLQTVINTYCLRRLLQRV
ncbi:glycoside hydrolase family 78 protein [Lepidopterella palustris CBS 459.81]|uniref:Glycoside hydrolase family 78 protein n=1 Tax=Lepidopterella palustris CBS 459.81 TaxID=1314670 RepID=A0A8E2E1X9_9PEZI|nr:glycoside hydrolase family 78 protein [Lepidopterella palustris CBS 459.81]